MLNTRDLTNGSIKPEGGGYAHQIQTTQLPARRTMNHQEKSEKSNAGFHSSFLFFLRHMKIVCQCPMFWFCRTRISAPKPLRFSVLKTTDCQRCDKTKETKHYTMKTKDFASFLLDGLGENSFSRHAHLVDGVVSGRRRLQLFLDFGRFLLLVHLHSLLLP